jgi:hypothetical protein
VLVFIGEVESRESVNLRRIRALNGEHLSIRTLATRLKSFSIDELG